MWCSINHSFICRSSYVVNPSTNSNKMNFRYIDQWACIVFEREIRKLQLTIKISVYNNFTFLLRWLQLTHIWPHSAWPNYSQYTYKSFFSHKPDCSTIFKTWVRNLSLLDKWLLPWSWIGLGDFHDCENNHDVVFKIVMLLSTFSQLWLHNMIKICTLVLIILVISVVTLHNIN